MIIESLTIQAVTRTSSQLPTDTFGNKLPSERDRSAHLFPPYIPLLPGHVTQDVYRKKAGQDNLDNFSGPAVYTLNTKETLW